MKKPLLFVLLFLIPLILIVLLKFFGVSHFSIPVYFKGEQPEGVCGKVELPYSVNTNNPGIPSEGFLYVLAFLNKKELQAKYIAELIRLKDKFRGKEEIHFILIVDDSQIQDVDPTGKLDIKSSGWQVLRMDSATFYDLHKCKVFLPRKTDEDYIANAVLLDKSKRIRGYYDLYTMEDTDRLSGEIKIMIREKALNE